MPLVKKLEITIKDFLPQEGDMCVITQNGRTIAVVTRRLYRKLRDYASEKNLPVVAAFIELRDHVHEDYTATAAGEEDASASE